MKLLVKDFRNLTKGFAIDAVASDLIDFNPESKYDPRLTNLDPRKGSVVQWGDSGKFSVDVINTYVNKQSLRASLGQGISLELVDIEPFKEKLGARLYFEYAVDKNAKVGARDLKVQMNMVDLIASDYLSVGKEIDRTIETYNQLKLEASKYYEPAIDSNKLIAPTLNTLEGATYKHYHSHPHPH